MSDLLLDRYCDTMQEAMTYASAATILNLGFDLSLKKIVDGEDKAPRFVIKVYSEQEEQEGEVHDPACDCNDVTDQFELGTDYGAGSYL